MEMTVKDLKELLENVDDGMQVLTPLNAGEGFDGVFYSPCVEESGESELGIGEEAESLTEEDMAEVQLLDKTLPTEKSFVLIPCGFFEPHDTSHELN